MRKLALAFAIVTVASISSPSHAAALADSSPSNASLPRLDVYPLLGAAGVKGSSNLLPNESIWELYDSYYEVGLDVGYRVSRHVGLGGYVASWRDFGTDHITVIAPEATYHLTPDRVIDLWGSTMLGLAVAQAGKPQCGDCGALDPSVQRARFAPILGVGLGFDVYPVRWVSIGVEGRASVAWFDTVHPSNAVVPSSLSPGFLLGVRLGGHIPLWG
jgi:hypothetical protein